MSISLNVFFSLTIPNIALSQTPTFKVLGTEPFWDIQVKPTGIIYSELGQKKISFPYVTPKKAEGRPLDILRVYKLRGGNVLIIQKEGCSDGMSDNVYPYAAVFILKNKVFSGCANVGK